MPKPIVVLAGRQNVGKSTIFNRMTKSRTAIVKDEPGVTRDRIYGEAEWEGRKFAVIDTGGFIIGDEDELLTMVRDHALIGLEEADVIVQVLDGKDGLTPGDLELASVIRKYNKEIIWVVNKIDSPKNTGRIPDFYPLGASVIPVSGEHAFNFDEYMDEVISRFKPESYYEEPPSDYPRVAIVGRPNVGKSTLVNALLGKEKMIVSAVSGTTRDSVDSLCSFYGRKYMLVDTAGLRKKNRITYDVERFSSIRAIRSIERADVVILVIDATAGVVEQDKKIASLIDKAGKGMIILVNKWDLLEEPEKAFHEFQDLIERELNFAKYASVLTTSGINKQRITKVFPIIDEVMEQRTLRVTTGLLNNLSEMINRALPLHKGKQTRVFYMTQVDINPPQFTIFVNYKEAVRDHHIRYIEGMIRKEYPFKGTPIKIYVRSKSR
ncbi:MAG: ribosome biogenesis GTPase Der [Nitrospirae bacterium]|nr:ribosome biogenesis GTPase Der [Nitrospirota bacterium]MBF0519011.1 ribosome biogenesis GTPase Der [Nitrospirota bacterium]MBF0536464.1 ribosome biogenesis GTPase Der [Nitrospirota bacterium]MBF0618446.1 ribosome biogenesis GTPase Der [Nitrospirota bacterium]